MTLTTALPVWLFACGGSLALNVAAQTHVRQSLLRRRCFPHARSLAAALRRDAGATSPPGLSRLRGFIVTTTRPALALAGLPATSTSPELRDRLGRELLDARRRRHEHLGWYLLEPLVQPGVPLLGLLVLATWDPQIMLFGESPARTALVMIAFKLVADAVLWARLRGEPMPLRALALAPLKECVMLVIWVLGLRGPTRRRPA